MGHYHDLNKHLSEVNRELRTLIPDAFSGFAHLHKAALAEGALDAKTKELIALAIAIAEQCDGCIASHARNAHRKGANRQEVAETIGVAMLMLGGPATVYGPRAFEAFEEFSGDPVPPR
jgi:AhpD family alkylhydroperoxidase